MKFFPERTKRILGVELMREIFVDGKISHTTAANVQRSEPDWQTPNVQRSIQTLNTRLPTINCFGAAAA